MIDLNHSRNLAVRLRIANELMFARLMRLLCAAVLLLPICASHAGVVFTSLYSFTGTNDGANPEATLVQGTDATFYGTTAEGGTNGYGTVFKISSNGTLTSLYSFTGGNDGAYPYGTLAQGSDGYFYGTTLYGGWAPVYSGYGTVFKISTNGVLTSLYQFVPNGGDGANPWAGLVQGSDGNLYGTTRYGGNYNYGTVFNISTNGVRTILNSFSHYPYGFGANPRAGLVQGNDGYFYGTTESGGTNDLGNIFKISTSGAATVLYWFTGTTDSSHPWAGLVRGNDGYFYGTTYGQGAAPNWGTVFKISTNGVLTTLHSFNGDGGNTFAGLVQGRDGSFYGVTQSGGTSNSGTVFRLTIVPDPQLTIIPSPSKVVLSWPTNYAGFDYSGYILQSSTNLGSSAVWTTNSPAPVVVNGQFTVTNPITGAQMFYRLSQ